MENISHDNTFSEKLTKDRVEFFNKNGYLVIDDFLGKEWSESILNDCKKMAKEDRIAQHYFQFGDKKFIKPNIFEIDLHDHERRKHSPELDYIFKIGGPQLVNSAKEAFPDLHLDFVPSAIKMQYNKGGGGCFPWHYDNPGRPSKRQLTCVIYLNPEWKEGDGGEIVVWPFLEKPVQVAPKFDRAVFFRSDMMLHRVMPSKAERFCFSIWCDGNQVNQDKDVLLTRDKLQFTSFDQAAQFFQSTPLQRCISRPVCEKEYVKSLVECVGGTEAEGPMVKAHEANCQQTYKALNILIDQFRLRRYGGDDGEEVEYKKVY